MKNAIKTAITAFSAGIFVFGSVGLLAAYRPALDIVQQVPALNSAGDHVYDSLSISDATGVVTTVTTAATFYTVAGTPMAVGEADGSACVASNATAGTITISSSARCALGEYMLEACFGDVVGANSATIQARIARTRSGSTTAASAVARRTEAASALRAPLGCLKAIVDVAAGDTYQVQFTSGTNADTVTTRAMSFSAVKMLDK